MGFRFQKSIKLGGGARLNISKSGLGASVGTKGLRIGTGPRGTRLTTSIPGTGLGYTKTFGNKKRRRNEDYEYGGGEANQPDIFALFVLLIVVIGVVLRFVFSNLIFNIYLGISMLVLSFLLYEIKTSIIESDKEFEVNNLKAGIYITLILMGVISYFSSESSFNIFCVISVLRMIIIFCKKRFIKSEPIEKKENVEVDKLEIKDIDTENEILEIIKKIGVEGVLQKDLHDILLKEDIEISKNKLYSEINELELMGDIEKIKEGRSYRLKVID